MEQTETIIDPATLGQPTDCRSDAPSDGLAQRARACANKVFDLSGTRTTKMCTLAFNSPTQEPGGAVRLCSASSTFGYAAETDMGNYQTDGLAEVWRGDKYRHVRKTLLSGEDLEPYCANCEYRFSGEAWMFQLHLALGAFEVAPQDPEIRGLIRRWAGRYDEYVATAPKLGLGVHPLPQLPAPAAQEPVFNTTLPELLIDAGQTPVLVDFNTLNRCNVSCVMCPPALLYDDKGFKRDEYYRLSIDEFDRVGPACRRRGRRAPGRCPRTYRGLDQAFGNPAGGWRNQAPSTQR